MYPHNQCLEQHQVIIINSILTFFEGANFFLSRGGGSNEYPLSLFWIKNMKTSYTQPPPPPHPKFHYIKPGFKGVFMARTCFPHE